MLVSHSTYRNMQLRNILRNPLRVCWQGYQIGLTSKCQQMLPVAFYGYVPYGLCAFPEGMGIPWCDTLQRNVAQSFRRGGTVMIYPLLHLAAIATILNVEPWEILCCITVKLETNDIGPLKIWCSEFGLNARRIIHITTKHALFF